MKIRYLEIKNYKQFSDLSLDLTYPKGHEKEGKPLDKICIIGQSGTGKTNLLEIIRKSVIDFSDKYKYLPFSEFVGKENDDKYIITKFINTNNVLAETFFTIDNSTISFNSEEDQKKILDNEKNYFVLVDKKNYSNQKKNTTIQTKRISKSDKIKLDKLYSLRAELTIKEIEDEPYSLSAFMQYDNFGNKRKSINDKLREIDRSINLLEEKYEEEEISNSLEKLQSKNFIEKNNININGNNNSWELLKEKIDNYASEKKAYKIKLYDKSIKDPNYFKQSIIDMKKWEEENENILEKIEGDINSIIIKFNLQLQINENTQSYDELIIKDLSNDNIIEYDDLSTGTKNLLSTFIPLKSYNPKDSIILIDEPENSFYPDIQRELTNLYMSVGENNQLIMATHSPLIASSFEPWEVVELKFDKNNQIYREKYYEGENHIDNYILDPRMLTWTAVLTDIFDLKEDSNFTFREKKLMEYIRLENRIKNITDKKEKMVEFEKLMKLSKLLGLSHNEKN